MGAGLWMLWVASNNRASAERVLLAPSERAAAYLKTLGHAPVGPLAQYLAAEQNRSLFEVWGVVQIVLAAVFFSFLLFGSRLGKFPLAMALVMLLIAIGERAAIIPGMEFVGRATDFNLNPSHRAQLALSAVDFGYTMAEAVKYLLAAIVAAFLIWHSRRSLDPRHQVDMVDKADHRHVDW